MRDLKKNYSGSRGKRTPPERKKAPVPNWQPRSQGFSLYEIERGGPPNFIKGNALGTRLRNWSWLLYGNSSRQAATGGCPAYNNTARKISFTAHQMYGERFCKGHLCTLLMIFDAHQRSSLNAPLPPTSKAVKAVFTHL